MPNAYQLKNVFSADELDFILKILNKVPERSHNWQDVYTNGFTENDFIYSIIKKFVIDRINQLSGKPMGRLTTGMQLITKNPFGIHSDFARKGDSGHGTAFLIPLYQQTESSVTDCSYTIVFDQFWRETQNMEDYINTDPDKPVTNADHIWEKHCDHNPREFMQYLSIKLMAPWEPGSVIAWDRELFHTSDNFLKKGITEKSALVLFTSND